MAGYPTTVIPLMTTDSKLNLIGSKMGGTFSPSELAETFKSVGPKLKLQAKLVIDDIFASGDQVVVQIHGEGGLGINGLEYNNTYCFIFRIANGEVLECFEYSDTALVDRIFFDDVSR